jgi:hypothetical protein
MSRSLARETSIGIVVILGLILYGVARYPASLVQGGLLSALVTGGALLAYLGILLWAARQSSAELQAALRQGALVGLLLGAAAAVNLALELFGNLNSAWAAIAGVSQWGAMFLAFGVAGSATYLKLRSLALAVLAAVWAALVSTTITLLCGYGIALLAMPHMQRVLQGDFQQSGLTDPQAFVIQNTLTSGVTHVLLAPCIALGFGLAGAFAAALFGSVRRGPALALAVFELLLAVSGVAALRYASALDRAARPPFIMFGLLALGAVMACLHPILSALRRPSPSVV